jgi:DDE superfamily endonuclease
VAQGVLRTLLAWMEVFRPALTKPGHANAIVVFVGWVRTSGLRAVTEALVVTDVARRRHHERFHRFFSRGTWSPDELGRLLFTRIFLRLAADRPLLVVIDDTMASKKGRHIFGGAVHLDPVRSTKSVRVFAFGHVWVVLSVIVRPPFSRRPWALPVLFRLYRSKKECASKRAPYRTKNELARELVELVTGWTNGHPVHLAADQAYTCDAVMHDLPSSVTMFGALRINAALTAPPETQPRRGRRRIRGDRLPSPEQLARSKEPWRTTKADLYGRRRSVRYKMLDAQWYRGCGGRLLRVVVVYVDSQLIRVFVCTDPTLRVSTILETYAARWGLEVTFRDLKQLLGFADSSARKREAVERTAPFVGFIYTTLVLWAMDGAWRSNVAAPPIRPWYGHKQGLSFADILRAAQSTLAGLDVLDPARSLNILRHTRGHPRHALRRRRGGLAPPSRRAA